MSNKIRGLVAATLATSTLTLMAPQAFAAPAVEPTGTSTQVDQAEVDKLAEQIQELNDELEKQLTPEELNELGAEINDAIQAELEKQHSKAELDAMDKEITETLEAELGEDTVAELKAYPALDIMGAITGLLGNVDLASTVGPILNSVAPGLGALAGPAISGLQDMLANGGLSGITDLIGGLLGGDGGGLSGLLGMIPGLGDLFGGGSDTTPTLPDTGNDTGNDFGDIGNDTGNTGTDTGDTGTDTDDTGADTDDINQDGDSGINDTDTDTGADNDTETEADNDTETDPAPTTEATPAPVAETPAPQAENTNRATLANTGASVGLAGLAALSILGGAGAMIARRKN